MEPTSLPGWDGGESQLGHDVRLTALLNDGVIGRRVHNALVVQGMHTVGDVRRYPRKDLMELRNLGRLSVLELTRAGVLTETSFGGDSYWPRDPLDEMQRADPTAGADARSEAPDVAEEAVAPGPEPDPVEDETAESLEELATRIRAALSPAVIEVLVDRQSRTLEEIGRRRGVSRERIRQMEAKGQRVVRSVVRTWAAHMAEAWRSLLQSGLASEDQLFGPYIDEGFDVADQLSVGRIAVRSCVPTAGRARVLGQRIAGYWAAGDAEAETGESIRSLAEFGPYPDEDFTEALGILGIDEGVARLVLRLESSPIYHYARVRGWVRRVGAKRDACYLILNRAGRPATIDVLARIVGEPTRNLGAQLDRDERFQKLYGRKRWALRSWDNSEEGGRYKNTRDAIVDILTREGPMRFGDLATRVTSVHHVTSWAVSNNLENEMFGQFPDGRYGMAYEGAAPYEEPKPDITADVDPPHDPDHITFYVPVTSELLRGSGLPAPRFVTWFVGLRRVPRKRSFTTPEGGMITLSRSTGSSTLSALRRESQLLRVNIDCMVAITLDLRTNVASVRPVCPCHGGSD